jgi:hypothetical protein
VYRSFPAENLLRSRDANVVKSRTTVVGETRSNRGSGRESQRLAAPAPVKIKAELGMPAKNLDQRWRKNCRDCGIVFEDLGETGFNDYPDLQIRPEVSQDLDGRSSEYTISHRP